MNTITDHLNLAVADFSEAVPTPKISFQDFVIRRRYAIELLRKQLLKPDGTPRFNDPSDTRVVFGSTLVDVAANMTLLKETAEMVVLIMEHTFWQVRLLSKSPLLARLPDMIPEKYWPRLILGFSTGTLDDAVAKAIEVGTGLVSKRIEALHELQDRSIRTFGMICPSLPQNDYDGFSRSMCEALRIDRCEHVWAEVLNVRGSALPNTIQSLRSAGLVEQAQMLEDTFETQDTWEAYARATFEAHTHHVPASKLRFLQYTSRTSVAWWADQRERGAFLIGKHAKDAGVVTMVSSAAPFSGQAEPSPIDEEPAALPIVALESSSGGGVKATELTVIPVLTADDSEYLSSRCHIVTEGQKATISVAKALSEIFHYKDGALWKTTHPSFERFCSDRFGIRKSHAYRLRDAGDLVIKLEGQSPRGDWLPVNEKQLRPLFRLPPARRPEVWAELVAATPSMKVTSRAVAARVEAEVGLPRRSAQAPTSVDPVPMSFGLPQATSPHPATIALETATRFRRELIAASLPSAWFACIDGIEVALREMIDASAGRAA